MAPDTAAAQGTIRRQRWLLLYRIERWLEWPMLLLSAVWLLLLISELVWGLVPWQQTLGTAIWIAFIAHFLLQFGLAPHKRLYLRRNVITALALMLPALRLLRFARLVRALRAARAVRGLRLVRLLTSLNRGMRIFGKTMSRRGFGYIVGLTLIVATASAAGLYAFERDLEGGPESYGAALWWTSMLLISMGIDYWPRTPEGRVLVFALALYGFGVFGYFTAALASFFVGQDATEADATQADTRVARELSALRSELAALRTTLQSNG